MRNEALPTPCKRLQGQSLKTKVNKKGLHSQPSIDLKAINNDSDQAYRDLQQER
jgi:hypothetical protein